MSDKPAILVAGAGSWGTALAVVLAKNGFPVCLWGRDHEHIDSLIKTRRNKRYLPGIDLSESITPIADFGNMPAGIDTVIIAVPCRGLLSVLDRIAATRTVSMNLCLACKGFATGKQLLNHEVVASSACGVERLGILSGPSFAGEIARGLPGAVTMAADDLATAEHFANLFRNDVFRLYTNDDIVGVQVGGAVKNVMAIAAGIADGLGYGANTRAALVTRGLYEITRLGVALGGKQETFMGLAGIGDLVLTCTDDQSRNRRLGLLLARGESVDAATRVIGQAVEGLNTVAAVRDIAEKVGVDMPITEQVHGVVQGLITPTEAVHLLLERVPKSEIP